MTEKRIRPPQVVVHLAQVRYRRLEWLAKIEPSEAIKASHRNEANEIAAWLEDNECCASQGVAGVKGTK